MEITPEIIESFRTFQPAFQCSWPDNLIENALYEADSETGGRGWGGFENKAGNFKRRGMFLFAAHWLSVTYFTGFDGNPGNISSGARLNVAAKSVADESITYRVGAMQETENDWLSLSDYGVQYLRLRRRAGMGAMAL